MSANQPDDEVEAPTSERPGSGLAVLVALAIFVLSLVGYPIALAVGADVTWAVGSNAAAVVALVAWTARRNFLDPSSSVTTVPGAIGTSLLVVGAYGFLVAGVLWLTGRWHDAGGLVGPFGLAGVIGVVLGLGTFAFETIFESPDAPRGESGDGEATSADEGE